MSQENVEIVREAVAAFNSADVDRVIALAHPEFEARVIPELSAEPDTYRGVDGIRRYMDSFEEAFEDISFEAEGLWDAGADVVVALRMTAIGKRTKIVVEQRNAGVWTVRDGRLARIDTYVSTADALRAAGLDA
jgi:ketosteroid isomerase-like protein